MSGVTAKEMLAENEFSLEGVEVGEWDRTTIYFLDANQDREAAHRWNIANEIRRSRFNRARQDIGIHAQECDWNL